MDQKLKQEWTDALRSGKYDQGRHVLRNTDNEFCCLGVLCDLVNPDGWEPYEDNLKSLNIHYIPFIHEGEISATDLPESIRISILGINDRYSSVIVSLMKCNDQGVSFVEIADFIDKYL